MGNKATKDNVAADMSPPNYRAAVQRLRTIKTKKDKISGVNGEIADIYAKVEGHKVNKKGARIFMVLDALDPADRADVIRSFNGLCDAAGWDDATEDMVDQAEGKVVKLRFGNEQADDAAPDAGDRDDAEDHMRDLEADAARSAEEQTNNFLEKARKHLNGDDAKDGQGDDDDSDA